MAWKRDGEIQWIHCKVAKNPKVKVHRQDLREERINVPIISNVERRQVAGAKLKRHCVGELVNAAIVQADCPDSRPVALGDKCHKSDLPVILTSWHVLHLQQAKAKLRSTYRRDLKIAIESWSFAEDPMASCVSRIDAQHNTASQQRRGHRDLHKEACQHILQKQRDRIPIQQKILFHGKGCYGTSLTQPDRC